MRKLKKVMKEEYIRDKVYCNRCGKEIKTDFPEQVGNYLSVDKRWGYGSGFDGEYHSFDICEKCYSEIIAEFKLPPADSRHTD
ncbi:MAG: hypothetical protein LIO44_01705 [Eubacterium sp.]|nr:hypothetical protein [Eubacterium sp.]